LPAKAKLRANWAISTLSDDDPTRVIDGLYWSDDNGGFCVCIIRVLQKPHPGFFASRPHGCVSWASRRSFECVFHIINATVATQVGVSSSISAKPRNPGQREIILWIWQILQLATAIPPGALAIWHRWVLKIRHRYLFPQQWWWWFCTFVVVSR
jgi:hypothetical protein